MRKIYNWLLGVFALIGGVTVCFELYDRLFKGKIELNSRIETINYSLPYKIKESISNENYRGIIDDQLLFIERNSKLEIPDSIKYSIQDSLESKLNLELLRGLGARNVVFKILTIRNTGDKQVNDLKIDLGTKSIYEIINMGDIEDTVETVRNQRYVPVSILRPTEGITIKIWSNNLLDEEIKITHSEGSINPDEGTKVYGYKAKLVNFISWPIIALWLFLLPILFFQFYHLILATISYVNKQKQN